MEGAARNEAAGSGARPPRPPGCGMRVSAQEKPDALELYRASRYEDAIKVCLQELQDTPNNIESHVVLGWSYLRLKKYQSSLDVGLKAIQISRNDPRVVQILGESYVFLGKIDDALRYLEEYVAVRPNGGGSPGSTGSWASASSPCSNTRTPISPSPPPCTTSRTTRSGGRGSGTLENARRSSSGLPTPTIAPSLSTPTWRTRRAARSGWTRSSGVDEGRLPHTRLQAQPV
ncbi:MAG: tetratricopeptide repeat protein [Ignavibacteriales bacterium]|nr:tetratricopeptide repeat protein [Ignavibacteriales bacterium]